MVAPSRAPLRTDRLRAVNEPQPVTVEFDAFGAPAAVGRFGGSAVGTIESVNETWRIDDEWWRQTISRMYFETMLEGGKRIVLFHDLITGNWFMQQP
jgi:hypothetical protein